MKSRILGLDIGDRRVGVALSDITKTIANPLDVFNLGHGTDICAYLKKIIELHDVSTVILGLPKNMDGSIGPQAKKVTDFGEKLKELFPDKKIDYFDERLSTRQALRTLIEADMSRARRKKVVDKVSAVIILQGYLETLNFKRDKEK
jgi:putative Holliday junction resolvase